MQTTWQQELHKELISNYVNDPESEWVDLNISTSGKVNLIVVSDRAQGISISQRKEQLQEILSKFSVSCGFIALYTVQEAQSLNLSRPKNTNGQKIQTWQDLATWAANPQLHQTKSEPQPTLPQTITFYSYKGGVGRTTALTHVAWILAKRGYKIVAVDLDLEAPSLSTAFNLESNPESGIVDFFYERAYLPEGLQPEIPITRIFGEVPIPDAPGRLFVVPAGILNLDYITKVEDIRTTTITETGETLWAVFKKEIENQLKPDLILVDSRTGINEWGALSLLEAADQAMIFLFPNEQNLQGVDLLLESLQAIGKPSINFVFSPIPDLSETTLAKVNNFWQRLSQQIPNLLEDDESNGNNENEVIADPLIIPYHPSIALANYYPVQGLLDYYNRIANLIDADTHQIRTQHFLFKSEQRWEIIESLTFASLNAADENQDNYQRLFQRTANFERFLDETSCLIRGRKGTGKTELYWLFLKYKEVARSLAKGRLDEVSFFSGHGKAQNSRPTRTDFETIHQSLKANGGNWEDCWRAYLVLRLFQENSNSFLKRKSKFGSIRHVLDNLPKKNWQSEHTHALIQLATDSECRLLLGDALQLFNDNQEEQVTWLLYDDLDEDFPERGNVRQEALTGLFQLIQFCDARQLKSIRFKVFLREDIWGRLNFDNKSHFNGRDILLQWTRVDFLRLALRQAIQSSSFKDLVDRSSPIENIDQANEESLERALELLWGNRRRRGNKAKYVSRWVYERLTDTSNTTFPRSLSVLLKGAQQQELTYKGKSSIQPPTDRLLRSRSLEIGLEKASEERCEAIKQEYSDLCPFFNALEGVRALPTKEELEKIWQDTVQEVVPKFNEFTELLSEIGLVKWRPNEERYGFADIYVYGFKMSRTGAK